MLKKNLTAETTQNICYHIVIIVKWIINFIQTQHLIVPLEMRLMLFSIVLKIQIKNGKICNKQSMTLKFNSLR